jgi:D-alanyl-D-alanine carboxypeptidase/D-alanyl-D-alanine-endopeptidase (penicillin-binding protein 4)
MTRHGSEMRPARTTGRIVLAMVVAAMLVTTVSAQAAEGAVSRVLALPKASLMLEEQGRPVIAHNADRPMVPASTMKILTALAAIERWGLDHRFHTDFHRDADNWLWVKGGGDPYLVSEELDRVAQALHAQGVRTVAGIGTDDSRFAPDVEIAGRSWTNNPYDAPVTALAANFNTLHLVRGRDGIRSAEPQTPLTPLARELGKRLAPGDDRVNLKERDVALRYFGELLRAKLEGAGITVGAGLRQGRVPDGAPRVYRHHNSRDLRAVLAAMLEYSSNFVANDLFLLLSDADDGGPLTMGKAQRAAAAWAERRFGWRGHRIEDGAGLSPGNRLSARQLLEAVKAFAPYRDLLPRQNDQVLAKTGTLSGVSTYAGFVRRNGAWEPFSLLINQPVPYGLRLELADALATGANVAALCRGRDC